MRKESCRHHHLFRSRLKKSNLDSNPAQEHESHDKDIINVDRNELVDKKRIKFKFPTCAWGSVEDVLRWHDKVRLCMQRESCENVDSHFNLVEQLMNGGPAEEWIRVYKRFTEQVYSRKNNY